MLTKNLSIIKYLNVLLVQYAEFMFKVKDCYDSSGQANWVPGLSFLEKYLRRIPLLEKCFKNIEGGVMKHCWFVCKSYNWNKISPLFEGDINLFKKIFFALYSYTRRIPDENALIIMNSKHKGKKGINFDPLGTLDGLLLEPMNPSLSITSQYVLS